MAQSKTRKPSIGPLEIECEKKAGNGFFVCTKGFIVILFVKEKPEVNVADGTSTRKSTRDLRSAKTSYFLDFLRWMDYPIPVSSLVKPLIFQGFFCFVLFMNLSFGKVL